MNENEPTPPPSPSGAAPSSPPSPAFMIPDGVARRAFLPELLLVEDVAIALQLGASAARKSIVRGECGPYLHVGRRLAVRRESFLESLRRREIRLPPPYQPRGTPMAASKFEELLRRARRTRRIRDHNSTDT